jgi:plasmid stability protein
MAQLTIADVPDGILKQLQERAEHSNQPIEDVARSIIVEAMSSDQHRPDLSVDELLERARKTRSRHSNAWITEEFLQHAKNDGRA